MNLTSPDFTVSIVVARREDALTTEQWIKIVDRLQNFGIKNIVFIFKDIDSEALKIIRSPGCDVNIGLIIDGNVISPRVAMNIGRSKIGWVKVVFNGDISEIDGLKNIVAAGLNLRGVILLCEKDEKISEVLELVDSRVVDYGDYDIFIEPNGTAVHNGGVIGNILTDGWDDIICAICPKSI